ncbi:MAG: phage-related baseplate assembly protein, partial [Myxococcota bacterium]
DRKAQARQFVFDLSQLPELRIAIRSPAAAIEDEKRASALDYFAQVDRFPGNR